MRSNHTREERKKIVEEFNQSGKNQIAFAREYGIKPNTLSGRITEFREKTISQPVDNHFFELKKACRPRKKREDKATYDLVKVKSIDCHWSPEQISSRLRLEKSPIKISYATIYRGI